MVQSGKEQLLSDWLLGTNRSPTFADDQAALVRWDGVGHLLQRAGGTHRPVAATSDPAAPEGGAKPIPLLHTQRSELVHV